MPDRKKNTPKKSPSKKSPTAKKATKKASVTAKPKKKAVKKKSATAQKKAAVKKKAVSKGTTARKKASKPAVKKAAKKKTVKKKAAKKISATKKKAVVKKAKAAGRSKTKTARTGGAGNGIVAGYQILKRKVIKYGILSVGAMILIGGLASLAIDRIVVGKFEGHRWKVPAKVYAQPLELFVGKPLSHAALVEELERLNYQRTSAVVEPGQFQKLGDQFVIFKRAFDFADGKEGPAEIHLTIDDGSIQSLQVFGRPDDIVIQRLDPVEIGVFYPQHHENRILVKLEEAPPFLIDALISTEDKHFYRHSGISIRGILRALWVNVSSADVKQGGSTLTQQLVKNFYLSSERTLIRKMIEVVMALLLESHYSKEEILEAYLNEVYLGQSGQESVHGFGLASYHYFAKPIDQLNTAEAALLVAMVKGPSYYDPFRHEERAKERRDLVLNEMFNDDKLKQYQLDRALESPLGVRKKSRVSQIRYPAYMELVKQQLKEDYAEEDITSEGLKIYTNLDPFIQSVAENSVTSHLNRLEAAGEEANSLQGAMVVTSAHNAEVVAVVGDRNPRFNGFNRALNAVRPIGSTVKPAVYLTALEKGYQFSDLIKDETIEMTMEDDSVWTPTNFDHKQKGEMTLQRALVTSNNLAAAQLGMAVGVDNVVSVLNRLGLEKKVRPLPSILLGALELAPIQVAQIYQTIAAGGYSAPLRSIRAVKTPDGTLLNQYELTVQQQFSDQQIYALTRALQSVVRDGTGKGLSRFVSEKMQVAGKTGTSNDQRDSWFSGFSGDYLAVVWVGRDDNQATSLTGSRGALPIWGAMMSRVSHLPLEPVEPAGMETLWVDGDQGLGSAEFCDGALQMAIAEDRLPSRKVDCAKQGKLFNRFKSLFTP